MSVNDRVPTAFHDNAVVSGNFYGSVKVPTMLNTRSVAPCASQHPNEHLSDMNTGNLLESGEYSDLTICCGGREFRVHRAVVCTQSKFFAAACNGDQEATSGKITLIEDDLPTVERMLSYLYTRSYSDHEDNNSRTSVNLRVYILADKYEIDGLKEFVKSKLIKRALSGWSSDEFLEMLMEVFDPSQRSDQRLHDAITGICSKISRGLVGGVEFKAAVIRLGVSLLAEAETKISKLQEKNSRLERDLREERDRIVEYQDQLTRAVGQRKAEAAG